MGAAISRVAALVVGAMRAVAPSTPELNCAGSSAAQLCEQRCTTCSAGTRRQRGPQSSIEADLNSICAEPSRRRALLRRLKNDPRVRDSDFNARNRHPTVPGVIGDDAVHSRCQFTLTRLLQTHGLTCGHEEASPASIHTYIHTYMHTCIHTYIHSPTRFGVRWKQR